jgi:small subunit ribosomal protein S1
MSEAKELENIQDEQNEGVEEESFKQMFEASLKEQPVVRRGEMIKGMVVSSNADAVIIDVGAKGDSGC